MTHALLTEPDVSVAIDQIPVVDCEVDEDQRGEPRPGGTMCDVGAFEVQPERAALIFPCCQRTKRASEELRMPQAFRPCSWSTSPETSRSASYATAAESQQVSSVD